MDDPEAILKDVMARESGWRWEDLECTLAEISGDDIEMNRRMAEEWRAAPRGTQKEVCDYYATSKTWLMQTYGGRGALFALARRGRHEVSGWSRFFRGMLPPEGAEILDYGGGFLKDTWFFPLHGVKVVLAEVEGPVTRIVRAFIERIEEPDVSVLPVSGDVPTLGVYDGAVCFEVLDHMVDPVGATRRIVSAIRPGGPFACSVSFGAPEHAPYHIAANIRLADPEVWSAELQRMGLVPVWRDASSRNFAVWKKAP